MAQQNEELREEVRSEKDKAAIVERERKSLEKTNSRLSEAKNDRVSNAKLLMAKYKGR